MGDTERPVPERLGDQSEQAAHLVRTGNGPTVDNEQELLAEQYGPADMTGFFSGPDLAPQPVGEGEDTTSEPATNEQPADEPAPAAAEDSEKGQPA